MMNALDKVKDIIGAVAPTIASSLGGPLAGVAAKTIADKVLGRPDAGAEEIKEAVLGMSGADLVKLKDAEAAFKAELKKADVELERIVSDDRDSARKRQIQLKDWTPTILGLAIIIGFFGVLAYMFKYGLPESGSEVLLVMLGALGTMTSQVGNFFFGSSTGSKVKDQMIADLKGSRNAL